MSVDNQDHLKALLEKMSEDQKFTRERQYELVDKMDDFKIHISDVITTSHNKLEGRIDKLEGKFAYYETSAKVAVATFSLIAGGIGLIWMKAKSLGTWLFS